MKPRITLRSLRPSSYEEAEDMGLIRDGEIVKCHICGSSDVRRTKSCYEECHSYVLAEYTVVCGECGAELGIWDHGAIFPAYL
jgi:hypothetical protein